MLEQSNWKRATILAKTAVAIVAAAMLVPLEPAALTPSDGGAHSAIRLQQFAYGGHNFEGGIGKTLPDKQSRASLLYAARPISSFRHRQVSWPRRQSRLNLIRCEICTLQYRSAGEDPLFTDFTASNIGTPANLMLPYYAEQRPDAQGYAANPTGSGYVDPGVGGFLTERNLLSQPSAVDARWRPLAAVKIGRFRAPTLRNVDKRPNQEFVKAYGHNGYFKSLKSIVHFYNTRDVLRRCGTNDPGEGTTCWPPPESTDNMNTKFVGQLGLSDEEENTLVSFMQTLTDGFTQR